MEPNARRDVAGGPPLKLDAFVERFCTATGKGKRPHPGIGGVTVHFGMTPVSAIALRRWVPAGFEEREEWSDWPYRVVWVNHAERATITYCEGDVDVAIAETVEAWAEYLADARRFYREDVMA